MNKRKAIRPLFFIYLLLVVAGTTIAQSKSAELLISFQHIANSKRLVLQDSSYTNSLNEPYKVSRLKYYVSNIHFTKKNAGTLNKNIFLMDAATEDTIRLQVLPGTYSRLSFTLGVDSLLNCSGAQEGPLDPLNGMFWTWNSGYIFFKLEGFSDSSGADLNRIEHHIGGYRGAQRASRNIELEMAQPLVLEENVEHQIIIRLDLDRYWQSVNEIKIAQNPLIMVPGELAGRSADNFKAMFSIISVQ